MTVLEQLLIELLFAWAEFEADFFGLSFFYKKRLEAWGQWTRNLRILRDIMLQQLILKATRKTRMVSWNLQAFNHHEDVETAVQNSLHRYAIETTAKHHSVPLPISQRENLRKNHKFKNVSLGSTRKLGADVWRTIISLKRYIVENKW